MMKLFFLILLLQYLYLSNLCFAQISSSLSTANSTVYVNSTNPLIWHNYNLTFFNGTNKYIRVLLGASKTLPHSEAVEIGYVCGFYCLIFPGPCYFSVIAVANGGPTVVWSANRNNPVKYGATLQLTKDGDLALRDSDGVKVWSTGTAGKSVLGMNMTQEGNLILFNNKGSVVWQSFDHPTDTLLIGQRLYPGQQLTSSSSETNWSTGIYSAMVSSTSDSTSDFVAYTRVDRGPPLMYYRMVGYPFGSSIMIVNSSFAYLDTSIYAELQQIGQFFVNRGNGEGTSINYNTPLLSDRSIFFLKLHSNGRIMIHSTNMGSGGLTDLVDLVSQDMGECQYPRRCGDFGLCRQGQCSCPIGNDGTRYFEQAQFKLPDEGCLRITPLSCQAPIDQQHLVRVYNVTYFNTIDAKAAVSNIKDLEGCKRACAQNCSCTAAFFRYEKNVSHGYCFQSSNVLSVREHLGENYFTDTYIKVRIPYVAPSSVRKKRRLNLAVVVVSGSSVGGFIVISVAIAIILRMQKGNPNDEEEYMSLIPGMSTRFSYEDLGLATEDFKENIGTGGFGTVFRGVLRDGTQVAVKRLDKQSHGTKEFLAEVESIGSIHHFNLVRLIGYCAEKSSRLLVYEFMVNGSLDNWIFNKRHQQYRSSLDWATRKKIILDVAKGLAYLHEECHQRIIHLDIKPQNILLDENFNAKVSDFGLAKLMDRDESQVQTTMRGTPGYIAPEWCLLRITVKVDVYSFGIVVLEIVCGRKNFDHKQSEASAHLLRLLRKRANEGKLLDIVEDQDFSTKDYEEEVQQMIKIAAWCLNDDYTKRPSMSKVVKVLENELEVEDQNISYNFTHALELEASLLSCPR